jgi:hypothetical protein
VDTPRSWQEVSATPADVTSALPAANLAVRTLWIASKTAWFKPNLLQEALQNSEEFKQSGLGFATDEKQADVVILVNRPLFTFDWTYTIVHRETGTSLGNGKVTAWDDKAAAPKLAKEILARLKSSRPASQTGPQPQPGAEEPGAVP